MPELPEVETVRRTLERQILNKTITDVKVYYERMLENCTKEDTDSNYPCLAVLPDVAKQYEKLYQGEKGKEYCENDISEEDSCEVVVTNDKTFWGYGLKKGEAAN